ncbi:MAG: FixH family protein [Oleiphilaceae bacterium]|nr:FixH family protein [Oleiphilaceae bacterium]
MVQEQDSAPWYRQRWLWFVLSIPIASIILSSIMVYVAVVGKDTVVKGDYYKDGRGYEQNLVPDKKADELGLQPVLTVTESGAVSVRLDTNKIVEAPLIILSLIHPTLSEKDMVITLTPSGEGFEGQLPDTPHGRWEVNLVAFDGAWRIREDLTLPLQQQRLNQDLP